MAAQTFLEQHRINCLLTRLRIWKHIKNHHLTCILFLPNIINMGSNDEDALVDEPLLTSPSKRRADKRQADASPSSRGKKHRAKGTKGRVSETNCHDETQQGRVGEPGDAPQGSKTLPSRSKGRKPETARSTDLEQQPTASTSAAASGPAPRVADQTLPPPFTPTESRRLRGQRWQEKHNRKDASQQTEPEEPQNTEAVGKDLALVETPRSEASWSPPDSAFDDRMLSFH